MLTKSLKNFYLAQLALVIGLIGCVSIRPHGLFANAGLSYFGNYATTIIPYGIALLGGSWFYYRASDELPPKGYALSKIAFMSFAVLYIGLFITPYTFNYAVSWLHTWVGVVLFSEELILTAWIVIKSGFDPVLGFTWVMEFVAGLLCAVYTPPRTGYLLECQILFQLAFIVFYSRYLSKNKAMHKLSEVELRSLTVNR